MATALRLKVLVVDDERMYRYLLQKALEAEEYEVLIAEDGERAIQLIEQNNFDIVLTDLAMPGKDGLAVLRAAKKKNDLTVVIIITGYASLDTALAAIHDGVYDYITKPFQLDEIKLTLKNASERINLKRLNEELLAKLEEAYHKLDDLTQNRQQSEYKITEIDKQLAQRQQEITDNMRRLRGFHDRVFPFQFESNRAVEEEPKEDQPAYSQIKEAIKLWKNGAITEQEFRILKRKILNS